MNFPQDAVEKAADELKSKNNELEEIIEGCEESYPENEIQELMEECEGFIHETYSFLEELEAEPDQTRFEDEEENYLELVRKVKGKDIDLKNVEYSPPESKNLAEEKVPDYKYNIVD